MGLWFSVSSFTLLYLHVERSRPKKEEAPRCLSEEAPRCTKSTVVGRDDEHLVEHSAAGWRGWRLERCANVTTMVWHCAAARGRSCSLHGVWAWAAVGVGAGTGCRVVLVLVLVLVLIGARVDDDGEQHVEQKVEDEYEEGPEEHHGVHRVHVLQHVEVHARACREGQKQKKENETELV